ncbi:MAG: hypothetical protein JSS62_04910 [Verrucomicrobia bacterium]|nr:hypothetical protein [Verrucomicrobiota bacterium]MBS0647511.1 hypothetical protein [Verrucomicrobiota bacterium]
MTPPISVNVNLAFSWQGPAYFLKGNSFVDFCTVVVDLTFPDSRDNLRVVPPPISFSGPCPFQPCSSTIVKPVKQMKDLKYQVNRSASAVQALVLEAKIFKQKVKVNEETPLSYTECESVLHVPVRMDCQLEEGKTYRLLCTSTSKTCFLIEAVLDKEDEQARSYRTVLDAVKERHKVLIYSDGKHGSVG